MKTTSEDLEILRKAVTVYKSYLMETRSNMIYFKLVPEQLDGIDEYMGKLEEALKNVSKDWFDAKKDTP